MGFKEAMSFEQARILDLEITVKELRRMFDEVLWDDNAREEYRKIAKQYEEENKQ